jgi:hypothetical protein
MGQVAGGRWRMTMKRGETGRVSPRMKEVGSEFGEDLRICEDGCRRKRKKISSKTLFNTLFPSHLKPSSIF